MTASRDELHALTIEAITAGNCVDVVGDRGSGRTHFIDRVSQALLNLGWHVVTVRGVSSLAGAPLAGLALAGVASAADGRLSSISAAVKELEAMLPAGCSVIIVDDWDDLDEPSWGVISVLQRAHGIPHLINRLRGRSARHTPTGIAAASIPPTFTIALPPVPYGEMSAILTDRLGGPLDNAAMSRIYAKSGGNLGLAMALTDAARRENRLQAIDDVWRAVESLWSDTLSARMEALLEPLSAPQRDLVEILGLIGVADFDTIAELGAPSELERLEEIGLVELYSSGNRQLIALRPPLLAEYFRHVPGTAKRVRLSRRLSSALDLSAAADGDRQIDDGVAQLVRLVHEQQRADIAAAQDEWTSAGTLTAANRYAEALLDTTPDTARIDAVLDAATGLEGSESDRAQHVVLRAEHLAYNHLRPADAVGLLEQNAPRLPRLGAVLLARAAELSCEMLTVPSLAGLPDPEDDALDPRSRAAVYRAIAFAQLVRGKLADAERNLDALRRLKGPTHDDMNGVLSAMVLIARADIEGAKRAAGVGFDEARSRLDAAGMRAYGSVIAYADMIDGRYRDVDALLEEMLALGEPTNRLPFVRLLLTSTESVLASRSGQKRRASRRNAELKRIPLPDGPLPGASRGWARTQTASSNGDFARAATISAESGDALWERGARLAAAMAYNTALELDPDADRLEALRERIARVEGRLVLDGFAYAEALVLHDAQRLATLGGEFEDAGRSSMALAAYAAAADAFGAQGNTAAADLVGERRDRLQAALAPGTYDPLGYRAVLARLTEREQEIAGLAAEGLSNQQIADELVLSVRTVESHLHRAMRKVGVERRAQLSSYLRRVGPRA